MSSLILKNWTTLGLCGEVKQLVETVPCLLPYALAGKVGYNSFSFIHFIFAFDFKETLYVH